MKKDILFLFVINVFSAIGYSLIAPLYPALAKERGLGENLCGIVISMFAISNFFFTPFCPTFIQLVGRKKIFYLAMILEAVSTLAFGLLDCVDIPSLFLFISFFSRFCHGIGCSISSTLSTIIYITNIVYSSAASICEPIDLAITLGIGLAIGPSCAAFFYFLGGYQLPFFFCGVCMLACIPMIYNLRLHEDVHTESPEIFKLMLNASIITVTFTVVLDIISRTFYYPTLTNHLIQKYGLSIEGSSLFFLIPMFSYFLFLQGIGSTCNYLGYKFTIIIGLVSISIGVLCLPPIYLLPQSVLTVIFGLFMLGVPGAFINSPAICDLIVFLKQKTAYEDAHINDMASAIYNLGLNFGEAIGPAFGGYVTENYNFASSAVCTSTIAICYAIFFLFINFNEIKNKLIKWNVIDDKEEPLLDKNQKLKNRDHVRINIITPCNS